MNSCTTCGYTADPECETCEPLIGDSSKATPLGVDPSGWTEEEVKAAFAKAPETPEASEHEDSESDVWLDSLAYADEEPEQATTEDPNIDEREYRRNRSGSKKRENKQSNRKKAKAARAARKTQR